VKPKDSAVKVDATAVLEHVNFSAAAHANESIDRAEDLSPGEHSS
jgi:hypothetical protein